MNIVKILGELGLTATEAKTYVALLQLGSSTVLLLAQKAGVKRTSIYNFIDHLVELGIVSIASKNNRSLYIAEPPERLLALAEERTRALKEQLPALQKLFADGTDLPSFRYFRGQTAVRELWKSSLHTNEKLVRWIVPKIATIPYVGVPFTNRFVKEIARRGIRACLKSFQSYILLCVALLKQNYAKKSIPQ